MKAVMTTSNRIQQFNMTVRPKLPEKSRYDLFKWLQDTGFFTAPASTKYHGAYNGGLFDHSFAVMSALVSLTRRLDIKWQHTRSPYVIGMFHDLCKVDCYTQLSTGRFAWNQDQLLSGHGMLSVVYLQQFLRLTEEEILCINWHMGAFASEDDQKMYTKAIHRFPNVLATHSADMIASQIMNV